MSFAIVTFHDNSVSYISSEWIISSSTCFWPPFSKSKLQFWRSNHRCPEQNWKKFDIRILAKNIGKAYNYIFRNNFWFGFFNFCGHFLDNEEEAIRKAERAELTSDLSDHQIQTKRKIGHVIPAT